MAAVAPSPFPTVPPTSRFATLIPGQTIVSVPSFQLESGLRLTDVPVAYKTWGKLNDRGDNCLVICHALTGSADVEDWWGPLMGRGKAFDPSRFFIFCANVMGSPYGSLSPVTINPETGEPWGPECPLTTTRDDVRIHHEVLRTLGVTSVAAVIGGSMGGMTTLEWALNTPAGFVRNILPLATSARHSAWCISWGEAQRQAIYSDPMYADGWYEPDEEGQPKVGLAAARMTALLTYRSRDSFETRFGRKTQGSLAGGGGSGSASEGEGEGSAREEAWRLHNDGHRKAKVYRSKPSTPAVAPGAGAAGADKEGGILANTRPKSPPTVFSAQSYLRYQGDKFTGRFDANCYIHLTRKMDTHDLARPRLSTPTATSSEPPLALPTATTPASLAEVLATLPAHALIIGVATDGLFTTAEQEELAAHIREAELVVIPSPDGHDGFLLEFEVINTEASRWLRERLPEMYAGPALVDEADDGAEGFDVKKESLFGEAEADVGRW